MEVLGFNLLDLIVIAVILLSGVFALARGFVKEVLSIVSWVGAVFATLYGFPIASAFARQFIGSPLIADGLAGGALFLVTLFALSFVSGLIANRVRGSTIGSVDRSLGFVFGLVRGFVLVSIAYLALSWALPPAEQPQWVRTAKTMPLLEQGSAMLIAVAPSEFGGPAPARRPTPTDQQQRTRSAQDSPVSNPLPPGGGPGYKMDERREMDRLIQGTQ
jgi:membrane protein required for colicin V production